MVELQCEHDQDEGHGHPLPQPGGHVPRREASHILPQPRRLHQPHPLPSEERLVDVVQDGVEEEEVERRQVGQGSHQLLHHQEEHHLVTGDPEAVEGEVDGVEDGDDAAEDEDEGHRDGFQQTPQDLPDEGADPIRRPRNRWTKGHRQASVEGRPRWRGDILDGAEET